MPLTLTLVRPGAAARLRVRSALPPPGLPRSASYPGWSCRPDRHLAGSPPPPLPCPCIGESDPGVGAKRIILLLGGTCRNQFSLIANRASLKMRLTEWSGWPPGHRTDTACRRREELAVNTYDACVRSRVSEFPTISPIVGAGAQSETRLFLRIHRRLID
jgi:hypothetical protein